MTWSTPDDVAAKVRRRWTDGSLLRAHAAGEPFPVIEVPLRAPKGAEIGEDLLAARDWLARIESGGRAETRYALVRSAVGGRRYGRDVVPTRAVVSTYAQAWAVLGVARQVTAFDQVLDLSAAHESARAWVLEHPHRAVELAGEWRRLLAASTWLVENRGSDRYLREISAPGVDTKFAERHRSVLAGLLGVPATSSGFLDGLGLRAKPEFVRLRPSPALGLPPVLSEVAVRADELRDLALRPSRVLVVENEITYLSVDVPDDGAVLWGKGFEIDRVGRLSWLADTDVVYWGDLDTHGFAILDRLRAWLPQTTSVLMDRATLVAHEDRWGSEDRPSASRLTRLSADEQDLFSDLVTDRYGVKVRLEQERIDWGWARRRLTTALVPPPT